MSTLTDMVDSYLTPKLKEGETVDLSQFTPRQRTNIRLYGLDFKDYTAKEINEYKLNWIENNKDCVNILKQNGHPIIIVAAVGVPELVKGDLSLIHI